MKVQIHNSLSEISMEAWREISAPDFPFADYEFLLALETTHCVGIQAGWRPYYISLWEDSQLIGATYLYLKNNSHGEFIFDWAWAQFYAQHGVAYYPKIVGAAPFTPAVGPKLLVHPKADLTQIRSRLIQETLNLTRELQASGAHFLFITPEEIPSFEEAGFMIRHSYQFHWENRDYQNFEEFLAALKRKRRQQTVKERREIQKSNIEVQMLSGTEIQSEHMQAMYQLYLHNLVAKGSPAYLTEEFFLEVGRQIPENILLILAKANTGERGGEWIAGSLNLMKGNSLYGRYWGCTQEIPYLHFELCYYRQIEYCIQHGLQHFEAGAGGGHKWLRGLSPVVTYSAHWLADPQFGHAIGRFLEQEKQDLQRSLEQAREKDVYRN